ncbi:MAG: DUF4465 domain-containing protein [Bacteroidetes bacterium]|nr:DUF4465 domain-containing protein [Bacteroidota bacterium]
MRSLLLFFLAALPISGFCQTVSDFESPVLPQPDTFYLNYGPIGTDRGFDNGLAHFPFYTDSFGTTAFWRSGFAYSNVQDSVSSGRGNMYAARTGVGFGGSAQYAVGQFNAAYNDSLRISLLPAAQGKGALGFYATNSSYAYYSMRVGDAFSRKFGDTTGTHSGLPQGGYPDFLRLIIQAYSGGVLKPDTVAFYLADFRDPDSTKDYILNSWTWVSLAKLGAADSFKLCIQGSDTASFGGPIPYLNTPSFFCIDNFTTADTPSNSVPSTSQWAAKVYPNPAQQYLIVELPAHQRTTLILTDLQGRILRQATTDSNRKELDIRDLAAGYYILSLENERGQRLSQKILKQ